MCRQITFADFLSQMSWQKVETAQVPEEQCATEQSLENLELKIFQDVQRNENAEQQTLQIAKNSPLCADQLTFEGI